MNNTVIELKNVSKYYNSGKNSFCALKEVSMKIIQGEFVMISGRSGSGKSTLLNVMSLLDTYQEGELYLYNDDISKASNKEVLELRKNKFGFIYQNFYLEPSYSAFQNVEIPLLIQNISSKEKKKRY